MHDGLGFAEFYRKRYAFGQEHREFGGCKLLLAPHRTPGSFTEPPVVGQTLQISLEPRAGTCGFDLGAGKFQASLGSPIYVVGPADTECHYKIPTEVKLLIVEFRSSVLDGVAEGGGEELGRLHSRASSDPLVIETARRLWAESAQTLPKLQADALTLSLAVWLIRSASEQSPRLLPSKGGLAPWQVRRTTEFMLDQLARDVALDELAAIAKLSPFHFCRAFKQSMGVPPARWQGEQRIKRAQELMLAQPELGLMQVALEVGYSNQGAFGKAFQRVTGTTPSDWRRRHLP